MIIALDTEDTGIDLYSGCKPFFVTICYEDGNQSYWEWVVSPITRQPSIPDEDIEEIQSVIDKATTIIGQNIKFDTTALATIGITVPWDKVEDTLVADHTLSSILPHDLTSLGIRYLGEDISKYEESLKVCVNESRRHCRSLYPDWLIAKKGLPCIPSATKEVWRYDYWLPAAVALEEPEEHPEGYTTVLAHYGNADSALTMALWPVMKRDLIDQGMWENYRARMEVVPALYRMEKRGISISLAELKSKKKEYITESERLSRVCTGIADTYDYKLELPKGGRNKSLDTFVFDKLQLPVVKSSDKTGKPSFDAEVVDTYKVSLKSNRKESLFIKCLSKKAELDKAITMLDGYERFVGDGTILHPSFNLTGTVTTRMSSQNPNAQNVSRQSLANLRKLFGPLPGRVWYSLDAQNIELRIPAYEAGEKELIEVFNHPERGPYYGSYHLVVFDTLHPGLFKKYGKAVKDDILDERGRVILSSSYYQRIKNGNFARQYGAQEKKVDLTYGVEGGYRKIATRFPKIDQLSRQQVNLANKYGYVETLPDSSVSRKGYRLMTERTEFGKVSPTTPLCYHVSGTAGIWMGKAVVKTDRQLEEWRKGDRFDGYLIIQVHDEAVLDFPQEESEGCHKWRIDIIKERMESCGQDLGIPTPVSVEKHVESWAVGESV